MKKGFVLALFVVALSAPRTGHAQVIGCPIRTPALPFAFVRVNGQCADLSGFITRAPGDKVFNLNTSITLLGSTISLRATLNPDPFIDFGLTTVNPTSSANTYDLFLGTAITPGLYSSAVSQANLEILTPQGTTTVGNSQTFPQGIVSGYGSVDNVLTNLGVNVGTRCQVTGTAKTGSCDLGPLGQQFAPTFFNNLETIVTYTQDNLASSVSISGRVTINAAAAVTATPEPASLALLGTGLLVLGGWRSRQRT